MNKKEIFDFLNEHSVAAVATMEDSQPRLRYMWTVRSDEQGIIFHTGKMKDLYKQLLENPRAELCFTNPDKSIQIRVFGEVEISEDAVEKEKLAEMRPFLKDIAKKTGGLDFLSILILKRIRATVWTRETNGLPKEYVDLTVS